MEDRRGEERRTFVRRGSAREALLLFLSLAIGWEKSRGEGPMANNRLQMITVIRIFLKVKTGSDRAERLRGKEVL